MKSLAIALLCLSLTGCATYAGSLAGAAKGREDDIRSTVDRAAKARREALKRAYCRTTVSDLYSMSRRERELWLFYCGYEDTLRELSI